MKKMTKVLWAVAAMLFTATTAWSGDGTKTSPYTVAELNAQKDVLAASGDTVWVKADLKGLGEDGTAQDNYDTDVKHMAAVFADGTGSFTAYSWQILGQIALDHLTNTKDLLVALTYQKGSHPYGNTQSPQYASSYEPEDELHFSLVEVHNALRITIPAEGLRGYHVPAGYVLPENMIAVKVGAGYSTSKGATVSYNHFDGADEASYVLPKNAAVVLMAVPGSYKLVLSAALYDQGFSNGNALNPGTQAGLNTVTTKNRALFRFTGTGFERNSQNNCEVTLESKDEVYLMVSSLDANFMGKYEFETPEKNWISWQGGHYGDFHDLSAVAAVRSESPVAQQGMFDLQGRRLTNPAKGVYIVNGKKYVNK